MFGLYGQVFSRQPKQRFRGAPLVGTLSDGTAVYSKLPLSKEERGTFKFRNGSRVALGNYDVKRGRVILVKRSGSIETLGS